MNKYWLLCAVLVLPFCGLFAQKNTHKKYDKLAQNIDALRTASQIPGISMGISIHNVIQYEKAYGYANLEEKMPMLPTTPISIASLTKPVFATIFFKLYEQQKLSLDWKVKEHFPDYTNTFTRILKYFRSNMPDYVFLLENYKIERDDILLKHHLSHTAENIPGNQYKYNGLLYGTLSRVLLKETNITFDKWVDSTVINPLSLKNSASSQLDTNRADVLKRLATPYAFNKDGALVKAEYPDPALNAGAGLLFSSHDLLVFDSAYNVNQIISAQSKKIMESPFVLNDGTNAPYGYGWFVQSYKGYTILWHYGYHEGSYSSLYIKIPEKGISFVLVANSDQLSAPYDLGKGDITVSKYAMEFFKCMGI